MTPFLLIIVLIAVLGLLGVGVYGLLAVRNLIKIVIVLQILGKSALLALIAGGRHGSGGHRPSPGRPGAAPARHSRCAGTGQAERLIEWLATWHWR
jgi:multisubunit Na+/H+ antiporter MnhC subunit